jgi:hypothetical protein
MKVLFLALALLAASAFPQAKPEEKKEQPKVVTKAHYDALKTGITYKEAVKIIGWEGEELSRSELAGMIAIMYSWRNPDFSNMTAMFQNDKLTTKGQFGLK